MRILKNILRKLFFSGGSEDKPSKQTRETTVHKKDIHVEKKSAGNEPQKKPRPTRTFSEFFQHVKGLGFEPGTIIDVGAARGTPDLYRPFPDAYLVLFEPLKEFEPQLREIFQKRKGEYHLCALMSNPGSGSILVSPDRFGSSMMHRINQNDERLENVDIKTLDSMLRENLQTPFILKTDCQGADFDVIKGGENTLDKCEIIVMEVSLFQFWGEHHPKPLEILNYMSDRGFVLYDFLDGLFRPLDNALGQLDMVFVKENGMFRKDQRWG